MTRAVQPFPKAPFTVATLGTVARVVDAKGLDVMTLPGGPERMAECANAFGNKVWFPSNHLGESEARCERLEQRNKELWAEVQQLRAESETSRKVA